MLTTQKVGMGGRQQITRRPYLVAYSEKGLGGPASLARSSRVLRNLHDSKQPVGRGSIDAVRDRFSVHATLPTTTKRRRGVDETRGHGKRRHLRS